MVACGLGLAILPEAAAALYAQALALKVQPLEGLEVERRLLLAMRSRADLSPQAEALVAMIEAELGATGGPDVHLAHE